MVIPFHPENPEFYRRQQLTNVPGKDTGQADKGSKDRANTATNDILKDPASGLPASPSRPPPQRQIRVQDPEDKS